MKRFPKTADEVLADAQARLDARREQQGKPPIPRSVSQHAGGFVLLGDVIRQMKGEEK